MTISRQSSTSSSVVIVLMVIIATVSVMTTNADLWKDLFGVVATPLCAAINANEVAKCGQEFKRQIDLTDRLPDWYELQRRQMCCSMQRLRQCFVDKVGDDCPVGVKSKTVDGLVGGVFKTVEKAANVDCKWYDDSSWLCAPDYVTIPVAAALLFLMLVTCCYCCTSCCRRSDRRRDRKHVAVINNGHHYEPSAPPLSSSTNYQLQPLIQTPKKF